MAEGHHHSGGHHTRGAMDIADHRATFSHFAKISEWGALLIVMTVAFLAFAFAMGLGWWTGLIVFAVIGAIGGAVLKFGTTWWITLGGSVIALGAGGAVVMGMMALAGG